MLAGLISLPALAQIKIDRSKKPKAGPAPIINIKEPVVYNLANGMTILVVENHKVPKVSASLTIDGGPTLEGEKAGVYDMMGQMLAEGTTNLSKEKFDEEGDAIGANIDLNWTGGSASALTRYFDKALSLMADGLRNPAFLPENFKKIKEKTITGLKTNEKSTSAIASRVTDALFFGKKTALGEFTTENSVKGISLEDVKNAYQARVTPSRSYLTFVGDITPAAAKALAEKLFASWKGPKLDLPAIQMPENPAKTEINFVDLSTAVQGEVNIGNVVYNPLSSPDYHALIIANNILGGGAEAKLFMNLREKHGFTYGSYSRLGNGRFPSSFKAAASVRTDKVDSAVSEIFAEILNMRDGKVTQEELDVVKAKYNGSFALGMENPGQAASYASNILINNLPKDYYKTFLQKINAVTIADVKRVATKYFNESNSRIVIVGNGKVILPKLTRLGFPIKLYDKFADPVVEKAADNVKQSGATSDGISAFDVINSYLAAIGGKENVKNVKTLSADVSLAMMGRTFAGTEKKMSPNKVVTELKMGQMTVMKQVFDGTTGYQQQGPQKKDMSFDEIKEAQDEKAIVPQLLYNGADYKTEYVGAGEIAGEKTYRIKITYPSKRVATQEFSAKTGLLLKEEGTQTVNGNATEVTIEYSDYQKFGNLLLPTKRTLSVSGQELPFTLSNYKINEAVVETDFK